MVENAVFFTDQAAAQLDPAVDAVAVLRTFPPALPASGPTRTGGRDLLTGTELTAEVATAVVSLVAIFVMVATFAFVADLRRRELALLRMAGATPRQLRRMIIGEAALIGVVAPVLGCAAGAFRRAPAVVRTGLSGDLCYVSSGAVSATPPGRVDVRVRPGADPARVARALRRAVAGQAVAVITRSRELAVRQAAVHRLSRTSTFLVLGIALAYSLIAVANTMVMASSGRRREAGAQGNCVQCRY